MMRRFSRWFSTATVLGMFGLMVACDGPAPSAAGSPGADAVASAETTDGGGTVDSGPAVDVVAAADVAPDVAPDVAADVPDTGPACEPGTQNCNCVGTGCGNGIDGQPLVCSSGTCVRKDCVAGAHGCGCNAGGCAISTDKCIDLMCQDPNCAPGTKDCKCLAGSCGKGLLCLEGQMCVDSSGYEGGPCLSDGSCKTGNLCDKAQNICQYCDLGTLGCQAKTNGSCNSGFGALNGICLLASTLPPKDPKCYTPCVVSTTTATGAPLPCIDKLREGCDANKTCSNGQCLAPGEAPRTCADDSGCMDWQVCMYGSCYSNCDATSDCQPGSGCFKHACRPTCTTGFGSAPCPAGTQCVSDGTVGYCIGLTPASPVTTPSTVGQATFRVTKTILPFSNVAPTLKFQIEYPNAQTTGVFTIRKVSHRRTLTPTDDVVISHGLDKKTHALIPCTDAKYGPAAQFCALPWVTMGTSDQPGTASDEIITVTAEPNCVRECAKPGCGNRCPEVVLTVDSSKANAARWVGEFEVSLQGSGVGTQQVSATYSERPDGQWAGTVFYFGSFKDDAGKLGPYDPQAWSTSNNAFIRLWASFRTGALGDMGGVEMRDALTSLTEESWTKTGIRAKCVAQGAKECYPRVLETSYGTWVGKADTTEVPVGVTELPFRMNLKIDAANPKSFSGRVDSAGTLQYPGNPAVQLVFDTDPAEPTGTGTAATFLAQLGVAPEANKLSVSLGGRYALTGSGGCTKNGFVQRAFPWLVPGFLDGVTGPNATGGMERTECVDSTQPFVNAAQNSELARANPVPDGLPLNREVEFLDGVLVDQTDLYLVFREKFESFVPRKDPKQAAAYGVIRLKRVPAALTDADYVGSQKQTLARVDGQLKGLTCDPETLNAVGNPVGPDAQVTSLIDGTGGIGGIELKWDTLAPGYNNSLSSPATIHYLCEDNGLFDGGKDDNGTANANPIACPITSKVVFFYTAKNMTQAMIAAESCQASYQEDATGQMLKPGTCAARLNTWIANQNTVVGATPYVKCADSKLNFCDDEKRTNLRKGKIFTVQTNASSVTAPGLRSLIGDAFRYKTKFMSSTGGKVGFSPTICPPLGAAANPYCYEPKQVEDARKRIDCLVSIATGPQYQTLQPATKNKLLPFLQGNFAQYYDNTGGPKAWTDGFERLYAELLVTLGDDALTSAYASRFDLAGINVATFMGEKFETGGLNLTGVAGAEFYRLYEATEYYQLALDRLYALGPNLAASIDKVVPDGTAEGAPVGSFDSPEMVTLYLERLTRAATQKALAWNEIATRYQLLKKPDLAKRVLERAYVSSYLEAALLSQFMNDITAGKSSSYQPGLQKTQDDTQKRFRSSLNNMRDVYQQLSVGADTFGYADDYVPFPALEESGLNANAYSALADIAKTKMVAAATREQVALESNLTGRVDAVQFATELVNIGNTYENQLASLCGSFTGDDGLVYPAIKKYADKSVTTALMGDPCGRQSGGDIYEAVLKIQDQDGGMRQTTLRFKNVDGQIDDELTRLAATCAINDKLAADQLVVDKAGATLTQQRAKAQADMDYAKTGVDAASQAAQTASGACAGTPFPGTACAVASVVSVAAMTAQLVVGGLQWELAGKYADLEKLQADAQNNQTKLEGDSKCKLDTIANVVTINNLLRQQSEIRLDAFRAAISAQTALSELQSLKNQATRLQAQQAQAEGLQIDFASAKNDPNVRLYQNDAVIEADIFYRDTLKAVYAATRAFEYFTSQTYAKKGDLYLARMVQTGQNNLQDYMTGLDNAFLEYQQQYGSPDLRVITLSLKDDILPIPREVMARNPDDTIKTDADGVPYINQLDSGERTKLLRDALQDPTHYDSNGYLSIPFTTRVADLSPLTRNHKIHHIEIDIQGSDLGDNLGRVYLRMLGTGSIQRLDDLTSFYALPVRTAVINTLMGSVKYYQSGDVYASYHLRDRPLVNSLWQLVINQRDEKVNQDIKLGTLSDILVHIYYTDVTKF